LNLPYMLLQSALNKNGNSPTVEKSDAEYHTGIVFTNYTVNLIADLTKIQTLFTTGEIAYEKAV
ncbi:MAG: hypothetical protein QMD07_09015, partial [Thermodesulfovibrionales bacterium]|nr:hypothetical protein [Thermodesulfovibrionales bacterium]